MLALLAPSAALLLQFIGFAAAHGHDSHSEMGSRNGTMLDLSLNKTTTTSEDANDPWNLPSYSGLDANSGFLLAHIVFMVAAWLFLLPIGVVLSLARSRLTLSMHLFFLVLNGCGLFFGIYYNANTPDLYPDNAHHKIGWLATCVVTAQVALGLLFTFSAHGNKEAEKDEAETTVPAEREAFLPISIEAMAEHHKLHGRQGYEDIRWSKDSGQGTERASSSLNSPDREEYESYEKHRPEGDEEDDTDEVEHGLPQRQQHVRRSLHQFIRRRLPCMLSVRTLKLSKAVYDAIDRIILILAFIALISGGVTYAGIMRANNVFNGLAHLVKGGIFFWYGLLTLGRWTGSFADLGWAWNIKPSRSEIGRWKSSVPTAEFTESFVIFLYGATNVFLEHLAAWGGAWNAQDLEHVSISIMFFGGGLCGMLVESKHVREWLNMSVSHLNSSRTFHLQSEQVVLSPPRSYSFSMNPLPALIILLLGLMMSSHHQDSAISTMVHKQWGTLLVGFSLARAVTYLLFFLSPPTSLYPSRPPSELVSSFCLISGGLIFMASTRDVVRSMEEHHLMAMFLFTVCMGLTAFLMAYEIAVLAIKGWATRSQKHSSLPKSASAGMDYPA